MSEYIIEWFGIGARIVELVGSETPCLAVKHLRKERLREPIVRCRDCVKWDYDSTHPKKACYEFSNPEDGYIVATGPDGFCAWGERRNDTENGIEVE